MLVRILAALILFLVPLSSYADTPAQVDFLVGGLTDSSGQPLAGGKVYTYSAGTTTNKTTWQDAAKTTPHANPIVLDGQGKKLVFADGLYKFRIDNSADVTQYTHDNLNFATYSGSSTFAGTTTGAANAYVATLSPPLLALANGAVISFEANHTNTGAATLNVNGLGAIDLNRSDDTALATRDIVSGTTYTAVYDSSTNAWLVEQTTSKSGNYTPTLTNVTNIGAATAGLCNYIRVMNVVHVGCTIDVDPQTAVPTATEVGITVPIASTFTLSTDAAGTCVPITSLTERPAAIQADSANSRVAMKWASNDTNNHTMICTFLYVIK